MHGGMLLRKSIEESVDDREFCSSAQCFRVRRRANGIAALGRDACLEKIEYENAISFPNLENLISLYARPLHLPCTFLT